MTRKRETFLFAGLLMLALVFALPAGANAATVDINGHTVKDRTEIVNGVTMISQDTLEGVFYLDCTLDGKAFTLTGADGQLVIEGNIGSKTLTVNDEKIKMAAAAEKSGSRLALPLRPLVEAIGGDITWDGDTSRVLARYDYNAYNDIDAATVSDEPMRADVVVNSGLQAPDGFTAISTDTLFEKRQGGHLLAIGKGDDIHNHNLIAPVHEGYAIVHIRADKPYYGIGKDYLYWMEAAPDASDPLWYLYVQPRDKSSAPVCVDEIQAENATFANATVWHDVCFDNGRLLWTRPDTDKQLIELCYYEAATGETRVLDRLQPPPRENQNLSGFYNLALGDNDAILAERCSIENHRAYSTLTRFDLTSGQPTTLSRGYNLDNPSIVGDTLFVVAAAPMGSELDLAHPNDDGSLNRVSNSLWAYDLKKNSWRYTLRTEDLPGATLCQFSQPTVLDEGHVIPNFYSTEVSAIDLPVLDVATGTLYSAVNKHGDALLLAINPDDSYVMENSNRLFFAFSPLDDYQQSLVQTISINPQKPDNPFYNTSHVVKFTW